MRILLAQHGLSLPKEADPERGLSPEGIKDVERIAAVAAAYGVQVSTIKHSGKKRAEMTAAIFARALCPGHGVVAIDGLGPMDDVTVFASTISRENQVLYVGHLPFMERLTSFLTTGGVEKPVFKFQNGGLVCLERREDDGQWQIVWTLMPRID